MMNSESESSSLREDRFELASILRTFQKQQQTLVLASLDDDKQTFSMIRMEGSRIRLLPQQNPGPLASPLTLVAEGSEAKNYL